MSLWRKLPWGSFMAKEMTRPGAFPFFVGGAFSFLVCGVGIQSTVTEEDRLGSVYWQQFKLGNKDFH